MNQLLNLQNLSIQKKEIFLPDSQKNLANITNFYLDDQKHFQEENHYILKDSEQARQLQLQLTTAEGQLAQQQGQADEEYNRQLVRHNLVMGGLKLLVLIPLLIIFAVIFKRSKESIYKPTIIAIGIPIILKISVIMHEHFPSRAFKYFLIISLILLTSRALILMLRMISTPKLSWLIKQYREAYQALQCPMCQYTIQPGILKFFIPLIKKKNIKISDMNFLKTIDEYSCSNCGQQLFEKCSKCSSTRHSLLLYCDHCGDKKNLI